MTRSEQHRGGVAGIGARTCTVIALLIILIPAINAAPPSPQWTFTTLYTFTGMADGSGPDTPLLRDTAGNLYGTTRANTIFKLDASGKLTTVHTFRGFRPPQGLNGLFMTPQGTFYDTSLTGGHYKNGTVLKVSPLGKPTLLWQFSGENNDGVNPSGGLIRDAKGNFYGVTADGGVGNCGGCRGTVFKIDLKANPVQQVLYSFTDGADGGTPMGPLIRDAAGNLYGTTAEGGQFGWGTVFRLDNTGKETVLYAFTGGTDGSTPRAGVIRDSTGNFYGTTEFGGALSCDNGNGCGVVFKINKSGEETVLHTFTGGVSDGAVPIAGLVRDQAGNLYGTTDEGGIFPVLTAPVWGVVPCSRSTVLRPSPYCMRSQAGVTGRARSQV